jgi:NAD-dependent deacetylase
MRCLQSRFAADITLFNESLPVDELHRVKRALRECDLFLAVGTSGAVSPASEFVRGAAYNQARTILVNLTPMEVRNPYFGEEYLGRAEEILPQLLGA